MPLPDRLKPSETKSIRDQETVFFTLLVAIAKRLDDDADEQDPELIRLVTDWNDKAGRAFSWQEFYDYHLTMTPEAFVHSALQRQAVVDDLTFDDAVQLVEFILSGEGTLAETDHAVVLLEQAFPQAAPTELIFQPELWFKRPEFRQINLSAQERVGYLMKYAGVELPDSPALHLGYSLPEQ